MKKLTKLLKRLLGSVKLYFTMPRELRRELKTWYYIQLVRDGEDPKLWFVHRIGYKPDQWFDQKGGTYYYMSESNVGPTVCKSLVRSEMLSLMNTLHFKGIEKRVSVVGYKSFNKV